MRIANNAGQTIFSLAIIGLGGISLATGHFASVWQPVPKDLPARLILAYANGVLMVGLGAGLLSRSLQARAALALGVYFALWFVLLHGPIVAASPGVADHWSAFGENATLIVGALLLYAAAPMAGEPDSARWLRGARGVRTGCVVFALAACLMSLDNLAYLRANADFPPAWIPHWMGWGYLVGCGFIATGLAILCRIAARLATCLAASMMSALTLLCWGSFVLQAPGNRVNWTGLMVSSALTGAGWLVAGSYRGAPWLAAPARPLSAVHDRPERGG
jgi:hypothetical protein